VKGKLEAPKHLARSAHDLYFEPKYEEFRPRTIWSLSNAFTSAFKELDPIPQFKATAKLAEFLEGRFSGSFWLGRYRPGRRFDCLTLGNVIHSLARFLSRPLHELVVPKSASTAFRRCEAITRNPKS